MQSTIPSWNSILYSVCRRDGSNHLERFESLVLRAIENKEGEIFEIALLRDAEVVTTPLSK